LVVWVLDAARGKIGTTRDLETESVVLQGDGSSNYNDVIDERGMAFQSQVFFTEYASAIDEGSVENPGLRGILAESGATFLTRLRARIIPAALRTNLAVATVTTQGTAELDNFHTVQASDCVEEVPDTGEMTGPADAGPEMDMAPEMPATDTGPSADGGSTGSDDDDDDDDGGCAANATSTTAPLLLLLLFLPLTLRRRRR
jgi:MYXO-CTERM domain-containing protein